MSESPLDVSLPHGLRPREELLTMTVDRTFPGWRFILTCLPGTRIRIDGVDVIVTGVTPADDQGQFNMTTRPFTEAD